MMRRLTNTDELTQYTNKGLSYWLFLWYLIFLWIIYHVRNKKHSDVILEEEDEFLGQFIVQELR